MEQGRAGSGGLPLSFYIRSAKLCLKKATLARIQPNTDEELQHLRRFEALVACALPAHKEYSERRGDKAVRELHVGLVEARRRIQELLESPRGIQHETATPRRLSGGSSPKKSSGSPKKRTGSPPSPKKSPASPKKGSTSRPKPTEKSKLKSTPKLVPTPKRTRTPAKRAESPVKKRASPPKKKADSPPKKCESPKSKRKQQKQQESDKEPTSKKQVKDWEAKLHDVYTFADEKPAVYYLPKKLPSALQKNRAPCGSSESKSAKAPPGVRDSTRSLPTDHERNDVLHEVRRSYDESRKMYQDTEEYYRGNTEECEPVLQRNRMRNILGKTKLDRLWDNIMFERTQEQETKNSEERSYTQSYDDGIESRSLSLYDENKPGSLKLLVKDLRTSLDGFRIRLEEEGKRWRGRVNSLEKETEFLRDETEGDLVLIKRNMQEESKKRENLSQKLANSIDALEEGFAKDMDNLRVEVTKKMENVAKETVEKCLLQRPESKEKSIKDEVRILKAEVELLSKGRAELESHVEQLCQIVENDKESTSTEQINIRTENGYIRKQLQSMKKEGLQARVEADEFRKECESDVEDLKRVVSKLKDEAVQLKIELQGLKSLEETIRADRGSLRRSTDRIRDETSQEKMLIMDRVENLSKLYLGGLEEVRMDVLNVKIKCQDKLEELEDQLREFKQKQESFPCSRSSSRGTPSIEELESRMAHLESKQELMHMSGLEESRMAIFNLDMKCQDKVESLEQQLKEVRRRSIESPGGSSRTATRDLMVDDLESRISVLERKQDSTRYMLEDAVTVAEKEKRLASAAASDATSAAIKAEEALSEVLRRTADTDSLSSRYRRSSKFQESLERESFPDLKRTSIDVESAVSAATEAKRRAEELQEQLKDAVSEVDRQRRMAADFAQKASSLSNEAKDLLEEMSGMRRTISERSETDISEAENSKLLTELEKRMNALEEATSRTKALEKQMNAEKGTKGITKGKLSSTTKKRLENEEHKLDTRVSNLENVASATYSNIKMLDQKVEHVSVSAQSALEGASIAERKCGALGAELVKVFRVLASFKKDTHNNTKERDPTKPSKESSTSPGRRPHFACESCKKVANTILSSSFELLPDTNSKEVKRVNLRLASSDVSKSHSSDTKSVEPHSPVREGRSVKSTKAMTTQERIAKVEESLQNSTSTTRRSWGTSVATLLAEETKSRPSLDDLNSWGIQSRSGICVAQEEEC